MVPGLVRLTVAPAQVVGADLVGADLADEFFVSGPEPPEVQGVGRLDHRHQEGSAAVRLLAVYGDAQPDVLVSDDRGRRLGCRGVSGDEGGVHDRRGPQGLDHRVPDEVGEAHLAGAAGPAQLVVEDAPVDLEQSGRNDPKAGGRRHLQARRHVGHHPAGRAPQRGGRLHRFDGGQGGGGGGWAGAAAAPLATPAPRARQGWRRPRWMRRCRSRPIPPAASLPAMVAGPGWPRRAGSPGRIPASSRSPPGGPGGTRRTCRRPTRRWRRSSSRPGLAALRHS